MNPQVNLVGEKALVEYLPSAIGSREIAERINSLGFLCTIIQDGKQSGFSEVRSVILCYCLRLSGQFGSFN